mgnify:CR=1 FL=1
MELTYWKVVLRYGHVGHRNEVVVARYIVTPDTYTIVDVNNFVQTMPGVKNRSVISIQPIDETTFLYEKSREMENFYMQNLKQKWPDMNMTG